MWTRSYNKVFTHVTKEQIWKTWTDINNWPQWNSNVEFCKLEEPFKVGSHFTLKPKKAPAVKIELVKVVEKQKFTDCTRFFGAKMYGTHEMHDEPGGGIKLTVTMKITGPLSFIWRKLVAENIVAKIPQHTQALIDCAKKRSF
jgi:hypothetical protein